MTTRFAFQKAQGSYTLPHISAGCLITWEVLRISLPCGLQQFLFFEDNKDSPRKITAQYYFVLVTFLTMRIWVQFILPPWGIRIPPKEFLLKNQQHWCITQKKSTSDILQGYCVFSKYVIVFRIPMFSVISHISQSDGWQFQISSSLPCLHLFSPDDPASYTPRKQRPLVENSNIPFLHLLISILWQWPTTKKSVALWKNPMC